MGALADRASTITSAPSSSPHEEDPWGEPIASFRQWLTDHHVPLPATLTEVHAEDMDAAIDSGAHLVVLRPRETDELFERSVVALLTGSEANIVVEQNHGMPDGTWMQHVTTVRDGAARMRAQLGDPEELISTNSALTAMTSALITASARRTPVLIEGLASWTAALVADRLSFRAKTWWHGAGTSRDPAITASALRIGVPPGLDLRLPSESVIGARVHAAITSVD